MTPGPTTPSALGLPSGLEGAGFNAAGVLSASRWDTLVPRDWSAEALLPGAVSALVLATGGTAFFRAFRARGNDLRSLDPIDTFAASVVREATEAIRAEGSRCRSVFYTERRGPPGHETFLDFVALAEASGLGARSRLALLLHPQFGPWLAIRAAILVDRWLPESTRDPGFDPCTGCHAPCAVACPGQAVAEAGFDVARCADTALVVEPCRTGCAARRACVIGPEHRYDGEAEAWHRASVLSSNGASNAASDGSPHGEGSQGP